MVYPLTFTQSISIHAPRTGSDGHHNGKGFYQVTFQSTLPARGATIFAIRQSAQKLNFNPRSPHGERRRELVRRSVLRGISIHAPRTGSDRGLRWC